MKQILFIFTIFFAMNFLKSQTAAALDAFEPHTFVSSQGDSLPYRVLWPKGYVKGPEAERFPIVFFLHGAGERGHDNQEQLKHGTSLFLDSQEEYPAIIVMPQCSTADYWAQMVKTPEGGRIFNFNEYPNPGLGAVSELLDHLLLNENANADRVYLMGLSMGGMGTFELLARRPDTFAAAIAICGGTNPALTPIYAHKVPLWIFHGEVDQVVKVEQSRRIVEALRLQGVNCKYTEYPNVNHNSWTPAFAEAGLLEWLFGNRRER